MTFKFEFCPYERNKRVGSVFSTLKSFEIFYFKRHASQTPFPFNDQPLTQRSKASVLRSLLEKLRDLFNHNNKFKIVKTREAKPLENVAASEIFDTLENSGNEFGGNYFERARSLTDINPEAETLRVSHLRKRYKSRRVVEDVSLTVRQGEAIGLLGPNGAGKTTVFYMISGLVRPDAGMIMLDGHDVTRLPMYRRARLGVGYLPQEASIFRGLTVEQNILAVLEITQPDKRQRMRELEDLLDEFDIEGLRKTPSIALSGGERRRCEIARALAGRPSFMLLDEPFAGIDPIAVGDIQILVRHLKQRGIGVLITDHAVRETLGLIDRAYIIHSGRVLTEGTPQEIVANPEVRRFYLGDDFRL